MVDDHNLVAHDKVQMATPFGMDLDERIRDFDDMHVFGHGSTDANREVHAIDPGNIAAAEYRFADAGLLLGSQPDAALIRSSSVLLILVPSAAILIGTLAAVRLAASSSLVLPILPILLGPSLGLVRLSGRVLAGLILAGRLVAVFRTLRTSRVALSLTGGLALPALAIVTSLIRLAASILASLALFSFWLVLVLTLLLALISLSGGFLSLIRVA